MKWKPEEAKEFEKAKPGTYSFVVDGMDEKTFNSGSQGFKVELSVSAMPDRDVRVFDTIVVIGKDGRQSGGAWKLKQLAHACDVPVTDDMNGVDFLGKTGMAVFVLGEKGYLEVEAYLPNQASNAGTPGRRHEGVTELPF